MAVNCIRFVFLLTATIMPMLAADSAQWQELRWNYRVFVLLAPTDRDEFAQLALEQLKALEDELNQRDAFIILAYGSEASQKPLAAEARRRLQATPETTALILIGKDGGVKARQTEKSDVQALLDLIDTMPMRQAEIRRSHASD